MKDLAVEIGAETLGPGQGFLQLGVSGAEFVVQAAYLLDEQRPSQELEKGRR